MTSMEFSYQPEQANWFTKFLWHSAGADSQLLGRCPKSDQVKYECLGGLVLSTSVLAFMSGSYAIYVAFSQKDIDELDKVSLVAALVVGLFWALLVYNLERFIVSSMGKVDDSGAITFAKLWRALPRILLSLVVGTVLAAPLEVRVLENEVRQIVSQRRALAMVDIERRYAEARSEKNRIADFRSRLPNNELAKVELSIIALQQKINEKESNFDAITAARSQNRRQDLSPHLLQLTGSLQTTQQLASLKRDTERDLVKWQDKLKVAISKRTMLEKNKALVDEVNNVKAEFKKSTRREYEKQVSDLKNESGLVRQLEIIHADPKLNGISFFLRLLLIIIETSPIFFKMMVSRSTYEVLLDSQQRISSAQQGVLRGGLVTLDGRLVPTSEMSIAAAAYEAELRRRSETEARLADEVHRIVRERTGEDIREHPESYYTHHSTSTSGTRYSPGSGTPPRYTAHTSGPTPSDPYGRRYVDYPSGPGPTDGPSGADPGMGLVGTGSVETGTSTGSYHVRSREDYERFISTARTVDTVVIPTDTSSESTEHHSGESSPVGEIADSSTSVGLSTGHDTSTFITDDTTTSGSTTLTDADTEGVVVDTASDSSSTSVDDETVVPPSVTVDMAEESLGHAEVVSPPALTLENTEGESTVSDFVSTDAGVTGSVDISTDVEGVSISSGSLDDSMSAAREVAITESSESTRSESHSEVSVERVDSEVSDSGLSRVLLPSGAVASDTELVSTAHLAEGLPSDDSSSDDTGDVNDYGHPVPSDSIEPVS
jgi:hypothetical protein